MLNTDLPQDLYEDVPSFPIWVDEDMNPEDYEYYQDMVYEPQTDYWVPVYTFSRRKFHFNSKRLKQDYFCQMVNEMIDAMQNQHGKVSEPVTLSMKPHYHWHGRILPEL